MEAAVGDLRIVLIQTGYWLKVMLRTPRAVVFSLIFPVILLVLFNSIFLSGSDTAKLSDGAVIAAQAYFTAGMMAYSIMLSSYTSLLMAITTQRESGELKRYRGTPVPAWTFIVSFALRSVVLVTTMSALLLAIAHFAYDVPIPADGAIGIVVYVVLGTVTMCSLGIGLTAVIDSTEAAASIGPFSAVILSFISGVFVPVNQLPGWLEDIGRVFPLFHLTDGLQRALAGVGGTGLDAGNVAVLVAWALAGVVLAARGFRWEPQLAGAG
jgi:ABC-2 type transport system permease protein